MSNKVIPVTYIINNLKTPKPKYYKLPIEEIVWKNKFNENIHIKTHKNQKITRKNVSLPSGLSIFNIDKSINQSQTISYLEELFNIFRKKKKFYISFKEDETIFLIPNETGVKKHVSFKKAKKILKKPKYKDILKSLDNYFKNILKVMGLNYNDTRIVKYFEKKVKFSILHYHGNSGLHCHVDNISGSNGPIVTIGLGSNFYYDIRPVFFTPDELKTRKPIRLSIKTHQLTIMDGEMRYCWQHCIPFGYKRKSDKYTLKFIFPKFNEVDVQYSKFFKQNISKSF
jgi:hypothetical protein